MRSQRFARGCIVIAALFAFGSTNTIALATTQHETNRYDADQYRSVLYGVPAIAFSSPDSQLQRIVDLARMGRTKEGYKLAKQVKEQFGHDLMFSFKFMETMVQIANEDGVECDAKILNEAIRTANQIYKSSCCNGSTDPELSFKFMCSLGKLGNAVENHRPKTSAQLYRAEGKIAESIADSPEIASKQKSKIAIAFFHKALSHAINEDDQAAYEAIRTAFRHGFSEYDMIRKDRNIRALDNYAEILRLVERVKAERYNPHYAWAKAEIDNFTSFDFNFEVSEMNGGSIRKEDYRGKVVIADLWATWCPPCRTVIPHMVQMQAKYGHRGLQVVGLSIDQPNDPESTRLTVQNFLVQQNANYPCGLCGFGIDTQIPGQKMLPTLVFLDRDGIVRYMTKGRVDHQRVDALAEILLNEKK